MQSTLSVAIITLNEEANLPRTLASIRWADEIVVVDSGSDDRTAEIADSHKVRFVREVWKGPVRNGRVTTRQLAAACDQRTARRRPSVPAP